jgi:hypothetical protein
MSSSEKWTCKRTLQQVLICLRPRTPYPPSLRHCIRVYSILIHTWKRGRGGGEGGVEQEGRSKGQQFTKLAENTNMTDCISDKHLPQSSFTGKFFR